MDNARKHWQDFGNVVLGLWLLSSPLVLDFGGQMAALVNTAGVGLLLLATALGAVFVPRLWEDWTAAGLGAWLAISPWIFDFGSQAAAANAVMSGIGAIILAFWAISDEDLARRTPAEVAH